MGKLDSNKQVSDAQLHTARIQLAGAMGISSTRFSIKRKYEDLLGLMIQEGEEYTCLSGYLDRESLYQWIRGCTCGAHCSNGAIRFMPVNPKQLTQMSLF